MRDRRPPATVFLDRDGVLNAKPDEGEYVTEPDAFRWLPGAVEALEILSAAGTRLVVVTNQRGVGSGRMTQRDLDAVHERMRADLAAAGVQLDAVYACTHADGGCGCRKPGIELFERAIREIPGIERRSSVVVGDALSDMEAGTRLGCPTYLVSSAATSELLRHEAAERGIRIDATFPSLAALVVDGFGLARSR